MLRYITKEEQYPHNEEKFVEVILPYWNAILFTTTLACI